MSVQLLRNSRLWVSTSLDDTYTSANTMEVLMQSDFSVSQSQNTSDVNLSEAGATPTRGSARFNDSVNPAEWNFSTYLRPYYDDTVGVEAVLTPDYYLWHALASGSAIDTSTTGGVKATTTQMTVDFTDNQYHELTKVTLLWLFDNQWYKVAGVQIGQAEISVDIEGIGMVNWTGQGLGMEPLGANVAGNANRPFDPTLEDFTFSDDIFQNASYIKNKLSVLHLVDNSDSQAYVVPITSASLTINNNITYLTPDTLSRVDRPIGSFAGSFEVTGTVEAYLRSPDTGDTDQYASDLLAKMLPSATNGVSTVNSFELALCMGGKYASAAPGVVLVLKTAHLSTPTVNVQDVLSTTIEFKGIPSDFSAGDEVYLGMSPTYTATQIDTLIASGV